ncbi:MAG: cell envelope integrity protein TolA [Deltaproteobacteria bacterium]|nr:cell envelope integrity protein TolA [Deltaproteobacteria bacterium]
MAWSPNRSSGKGPTGSPFFPDLSPPPLRTMLALSGAAHLVLVIAALAVPPLFGTPLRLEPVAVVDLIGGGEFRQEAGKPPGPTPIARENEKPAPRGRTASTPPPAARGKGAKAAPDAFAPSKRQADDAVSLTERLRKMREARAGSEAVRGAVEERRSEASARAAVRSVGERVAHRIEAPPPARSGARGAAGGGGGAQGTVRLSPELRDYFRRLEERVRSSWVLPGALARDAAKLVVELRIVIEKDGRVSEERIERGSGNPYFDDSVRRAIRKASPLPVPPEQLRGGEDHYEVGFRFHGGAG